MTRILLAPSFDSIWYWVVHVVIWTLACYRTLGVPHDMILRARRLPEIGARVDLLAGIAAERVAGLGDLLGTAIAAISGFGLAALFALGFLSDLEAAQASFLVLAPFAAISFSKLRLAYWIRAEHLTGPRLVLALSWRRVWHQAIAILAMLAAATVGITLHASRLP